MNLKENSNEYILSFDNIDFNWRSIIVYLILIGAFIYLATGAFELQIVKGGENLLIAKRTNQYRVKTLAPRGIIYSEDGIKLAYNSPSYSLYINTKEIDQSQESDVLLAIANVLQIDSNQFIESSKSYIYDENNNRVESDRITLLRDISYDNYYQILSNIDSLKGVYLNVESLRNYIEPSSFSNILGYVGDPSYSDIEKGIYSESQVGKTGVEGYYDEYLRGSEGLSIIEKEVSSGSFTDYKEYESIPGNNLFLTIDSRWQTKLTEIMIDSANEVKAFGSAGVIVNSSTGEIKALVTVPNYDNNLFAKGISSEEYKKLIENPKKPLFNRPISLQLPPGSVMKVIGAVAGLESGVISENDKKLSDRCMDLPGNITFCEADRGYIGWVNIKEALARSSNIYFCQVMQDLRKGLGYKYYYDIALNFGLASKTGIDLWGESSGIIPNAEYKLKAINEPWYIGDECNTVIGQGYVTVTPIQMALVSSAIVNGGKVLEPHILNKVVNQEGEIIYDKETKVVRELNVSEKTLDIVIEGLEMGVYAGTAGALKGSEGNPIAKTGSSDAGEWINGVYYNGAHSWIIGCFDYENEKYCFAIMQQWAGRGYKTVPIMKKFINCIYNNFNDSCKNI